MRARLEKLLNLASKPILGYLVAALCGVLLYQAKPWLSFYALPEPMTLSQLREAERFSKENSQASAILHAAIELKAIKKEELALQEQYAPWEMQQRDSQWAEATEFMLEYIAKSHSDTALQPLKRECRNTLCRVTFRAPEPLDEAYTAKVLKFASILKTAQLEYEHFEVRKGELLLTLKSSKPYTLSAWDQRRLNPAKRVEWEREIMTWYKN